MTAGRISPTSYGWGPPVALILFSIFLFWICHGFGFVFRMSVSDAFTVGIECVVRNTPLGLLLKTVLFPAESGKIDPIGDGVLFMLLFYSASCMILGATEVFARLKGLGPIYSRDPVNKQPSEVADEVSSDQAD